MKCEHCGSDVPERAVICPECGEILPREKKTEPEAASREASLPNAFSMPFLSASSSSAQAAAAEDPREVQFRAREKRTRQIRLCVSLGIVVLLALAVTLYTVFLGGYKLAAFRFVKGIDKASGSMYVALVPDPYMDYLENTYDTTRREVKEMVHDYYVNWNENYGTEGSMSYDILNASEITDTEALEQTLKTSYGISVEIKKAVSATLSIDDGGTKGKQKVTFVKIGHRWCVMEAMEEIDYVCKNDGYNAW